MKITAIPQLYRNLRRWREILAVLQRYGLADWLSQHRRIPFQGWFKDPAGTPLAEYSRQQRIRFALTDLGPTFIKLGQILAARPDLIGPQLADELKGLRADVRPDPIEKVQQTLAAELGNDYEKHFASISPVPLATASIGQVHRATLRNGRRVVVKVQRAGIEETVRQDIEVLSGLAVLAVRVESLAVWRPKTIADQLAPMISRELDFDREKQSLLHFADWIKKRHPQVVVPQPIKWLCTRRVLVMDELVGRSLADCIEEARRSAKKHAESTDPTPGPADETGRQDGTQDAENQDAKHRGADDRNSENDVPSGSNGPIDTPKNGKIDAGAPMAGVIKSRGQRPHRDSNRNEQSAIQLTGEIRRELSETLANVYVDMIFDQGVFHADPHTANLYLLRDGRLGILDFGMTGRIDETLRETIEDMLVAIGNGDQNRMVRLIRRFGETPVTLDESSLAVDVAEFISVYGRQSLGAFDLAGSLNDLTDMLHRHSIKLPNQSAMLLKMLISLEGTLSELGASFDSLKVVNTLAKKITMRRLSPKRRLKQAQRIYLEAESFLESAPDEVISLMQQVRRGDVKVSLEHQRLGPSVNRLVLGMMTSAVFLGSSLMMSFNVPPLIFTDRPVLGMSNLSLIGSIGVLGSMSVMLWILLAIGRSGHLTRHNDD